MRADEAVDVFGGDLAQLQHSLHAYNSQREIRTGPLDPSLALRRASSSLGEAALRLSSNADMRRRGSEYGRVIPDRSNSPPPIIVSNNKATKLPALFDL